MMQEQEYVSGQSMQGGTRESRTYSTENEEMREGGRKKLNMNSSSEMVLPRPTIDELRRGKGDYRRQRRLSIESLNESVKRSRGGSQYDGMEQSYFGVSQVKHWGFFSHLSSETSGKLGMIDGVYFRCLTNILGVIMFLRVGWMVGYAGILSSILVILGACSITFITTLSLSAICTNGHIFGGGAYYMISRSLGPEFGGSIGVLFYVANAVSVSMYLLGFAETVKQQTETEWDERFVAVLALIGIFLVCMVGVSWVVKIEKIMLGALLLAVLLIMIGAFLKPPGKPEGYSIFNEPDPSSNYIPAFVEGDFWRNMYPDWFGTEAIANPLDFTKPNKTTVQCDQQPSEILKGQYGIVNFAVVLSVFFPAVSGIMAGANVSGDLKDPSKAIPKGTLLAVLTSGIIYVVLVMIIGTYTVRTVIEYAIPIEKSSSGTAAQDTQVFRCIYGGLYHDTTLPTKISVYPPLVYLGIYCATISSGLAALVGAPRILQALAKDRLFPFLNPLARGVGRSQEPIRAYVVTFFIALLCILTGDLNSVAPLITTFFLSSYALVNYACFAAETSSSPGWRPSFRYFNQWVALTGALLCVATMLVLSAVTGFIAFVIGLALYKYIEVTHRGVARSSTQWGPARDAVQYNTALRAALELEANIPPSPVTHYDPIPMGGTSTNSPNFPHFVTHNDGTFTSLELTEIKPEDEDSENENENNLVLQNGNNNRQESLMGNSRHTNHALDATHVKNYRPQCLVLTGPPDERPALAFLAAGLRKAKGVTVFGDVIVGDISDPKTLELRNQRQLVSYVSEFGIKGFNDVIIAKSFREGCRSLIQLAGLGRVMRVNTVVMGYLDNWKDGTSFENGKEHPNLVTVEDYVGVIGEAFDLGCGVAILRGEMALLGEDFVRQAAEVEKEKLAVAMTMANPLVTTDSVQFEEKDVTSGAEYADEDQAESTWQEIKDMGNVAVKPVRSFLSHSQSTDELFTDNDGNRYPVETMKMDEFVDRNSNSKTKPGTRAGTIPVDLAFNSSQMHRRIDVYWFADDGGLTLMLPHLLRQAKQPPWNQCLLRVMAVGLSRRDAEQEQAAMALLLNKLRIKAEVQVVSLEIESDKDNDSEGDIFTQFKKIGQLVRATAPGSLLVVVSLPVPPVKLNPVTYMKWLDALSANCASPILLVRGSNRDVLTILS